MVTSRNKEPGKELLSLSGAAEALVDAASLEVDSDVTQKQLAKNLDSLKASFDRDLDKVIQHENRLRIPRSLKICPVYLAQLPHITVSSKLTCILLAFGVAQQLNPVIGIIS